MKEKLILTGKIIGPTLVGIIFSLLAYKILDTWLFEGEEGRILIIGYSIFFGVLPIASILAGMLSKIWLHRIWVSIFNVVGIWAVLYFVLDQSIFVVPFLPVYMFCGFLAALLPSKAA
ncbi:hypothetical protein GOQ27_02205 [Clostridium sp. D2Q-11]|uniref:Uncharacterized protein n=1 Tax=Anaeromonas frigoriresistens TaxID=2683708 RepID=A0A942URI3_9FIRM|nr:hypothetical protein [Anaeromonas frigoriresistens]MBS4537253.1 hypothetical protein [Anaeromonas frigoriresistens]